MSSGHSNFPDFFVLGAPKSGTTSLYEYFRLHPQVFVPHHKEVHFFSSEFQARPPIPSLERYLDYFKDAPEDQVKGMVTVYYIYSKDAVQNILKIKPDAKFILMLRDPVDLMASWHWQTVEMLDEDEHDFEKAWDLQEVRAKGERIPAECHNPFVLQYRNFGLLDEPVRALINTVPNGNLQIHLLDDIRNDQENMLKSICSFLGVDYIEGLSLPFVNPASTLRYKWLYKAVRTPPAPLRWIRNLLKPLYNRLGFYPGRMAFHKNRKPAGRPPVNPEFEAKLRAEFLSVVENLEQLLGRDLSSWKNVKIKNEKEAA